MSKWGLMAVPTEKAYPILVEQKSPVFLQASQTSVSASTLLCGFVASLHYLSLGAAWDLPGWSPGMEPWVCPLILSAVSSMDICCRQVLRLTWG